MEHSGTAADGVGVWSGNQPGNGGDMAGSVRTGCAVFLLGGLALGLLGNCFEGVRKANRSPAEKARDDSVAAADSAREARRNLVLAVNSMGRAAVMRRLKDPESARFGSQWAGGAEGTVFCGRVNAKNAFGAYTGEEMYFGVLNMAILDSDLDNMSSTERRDAEKIRRECRTEFDPDKAPVTALDSTPDRRRLTPDTVALDFRTGDMTIAAWVPKTAFDASGRGYVWAFFTAPEATDGSWSDASMPVRADVSRGDSVRVRAVLRRFHWATNPSVPRTGYRATVYAGPDSTKVQLRASERDKREALSVPVITRR